MMYTQLCTRHTTMPAPNRTTVVVYESVLKNLSFHHKNAAPVGSGDTLYYKPVVLCSTMIGPI